MAFSDKTFEYLLGNAQSANTRKERKNLNEIRRLRKKVKQYKLLLQKHKNLSAKRDFEKLTESMSEPAKLFTRMQYAE